MIRKLKNILLTLGTVGLIAAPSLAPAVAYAEISQGLCTGSNLNLDPSSETDCTTATGGATDKLTNLLKQVVNIFSIIVGVVAVIMIIVGGLRYITSGGESSNVSTAKNTLIYAIVGLVIVALAQFIVHFVLGTTLNAVNGS